MISDKDIDDIINKIKKKINPDKIYLFGSYAYGNPTENSDLDLLIIKNKLKNKREELINLKKDLISKDYSLDILLYDQKEYQKKKQEGWRIFQEIETKGKIFNVN